MNLNWRGVPLLWVEVLKLGKIMKNEGKRMKIVSYSCRILPAPGIKQCKLNQTYSSKLLTNCQDRGASQQSSKLFTHKREMICRYEWSLIWGVQLCTSFLHIERKGHVFKIGVCLRSDPRFGSNHEIEINIIEMTERKGSAFEGDAELWLKTELWYPLAKFFLPPHGVRV